MGMHGKRSLRTVLIGISMFCCLFWLGVDAARAQRVEEASYSSSNVDGMLPDAPAPMGDNLNPGASSSNTYVQGKQTKRILEVMPNFRSVSADQKLPPQSPREKLKTTLQDDFDYSAFIFAGGLAGVAQAENSYPEFHQGAAGFARYYWHTYADQTDENTIVEFLLPVALHQDSRYYTLGHGGVLKRTAYSFSRLAITRDDDGKEVPNYSEVIGSGAASGISDLYYPSVERTWTKTGQRWLTSLILDGATFTLQEFWPDINDHIFHQHD